MKTSRRITFLGVIDPGKADSLESYMAWADRWHPMKVFSQWMTTAEDNSNNGFAPFPVWADDTPSNQARIENWKRASSHLLT